MSDMAVSFLPCEGRSPGGRPAGRPAGRHVEWWRHCSTRPATRQCRTARPRGRACLPAVRPA